MKKLAWKFTLIAALTALAALFIGKLGLKRGIDLAGGTILVYEVNEKSLPANFKMDDLIAAVKRRVNPDGVAEITIREVGGRRVEIILPEASDEEVETIKRNLSDKGSLEFRILASEKNDANERRGGRAQAVKKALAPDGLDHPPKDYRWYKLGETTVGTNPRFDKKSITDPGQSWTIRSLAGAKVYLKGKTGSGAESEIERTVKGNSATTLELEKPHDFTSISSYRVEYNPSNITATGGGESAILRDGPTVNGRTERYILCRVPPERMSVTGSNLVRVEVTQDQRTLKPVVAFGLDREGARHFGALTREHLPEGDEFKYRLAIVLDGVINSAPSINSEIRDAGQIEMGGSGEALQKDIAHLVTILKSGSLPASLKPTPIQEEKIGPTLGEDTINKGLTAIFISMLVVPIFMVAYYRFAGVVAVIALVLNMVLLLGSMAAIHATFTLPGLAGLALTIGMAVDANVLIFERMREEAERGAKMVQQIRLGFDRAWITILDSHLTIFLSGIVLYAVGTEEIKGFALTLIIGMVWNLFTAVYTSRAIFDLCYSEGWLKRLSMMKLMDRTNIDFIGPRRIAMTVSTIVIVAGLVVFFTKGKSMYNIDFTGGTLVTIRLDPDAPGVKERSESSRVEFVRTTAAKILPDPAVETLNLRGQARGLRFNIRTTETNVKDVEKRVREAFGASLARTRMTVSSPRPLPAAAKGEAPGRFAGGSRYDLAFDIEPTTMKVADLLEPALAKAGVERPRAHFELARKPADVAEAVAGPRTYEMILRTDLPPAKVQPALAAVSQSLHTDPNPQFEGLINFGATVAGETRTLAAFAIVLSWLIIIAFLWFRFESFTYGLAAVIALVHDVLITMGAVAISPYKIDLPMVAAFLTLIGFSVNDTIVIFDRIREIKGKTPHLTPQIVNTAINQTLSRTILTSLTAWLVVVIMYFFGGEGLSGFSYALTIGFLSGTYSTVYIATPILIDWVSKPAPPVGSKKPQVAGREV